MKILVTLLILSASVISDVKIDQLLLQNDGWETLERSADGYTISQLDVPGYPLNAVQVSVEVDLPSEVILDVIHDTDNYENFLGSARSIDFQTVERTQDRIIGYQHIQVPYFSNRHYLYNFDLNVVEEGGRHITGWELIPVGDEHRDFILSMNSAYGESVYLDEGVGKFILEPMDSNTVKLSYRLYMDIGGWIPSSLVEKSNKAGILNLVKDLVKEAERRSRI